MSDLIIAIRTGDVKKAGTDLDVDVKLTYSDGSQSSWNRLDTPGDDHERNTVTTHRINAGSGKVSGITMRVKHEAAHLNDDVSYDAWFLSWIAISRTDLSGNQLFYRPNKWVEVPQGDPNWYDVDLGAPTLSIPADEIAEIVKFVGKVFSWL